MYEDLLMWLIPKMNCFFGSMKHMDYISSRQSFTNLYCLTMYWILNCNEFKISLLDIASAAILIH